MKYKKYLSMIVVAVLALCHSAMADRDVGVRAQSFGGAFRAVASSNDIIFYNPAGLLKNRRIGADLDYNFGSSDGHNLSVSLIDSATSSWGMGLAYNACVDATQKGAHLFNIALSMPIVSDLFSLGGSFYYLYHPQHADDYEHFLNIDAAIMANLPMGLSLALAVDHLLKAKGLEKPMGISLAAAIDMGKIAPQMPVTFSLDWIMDDVKSDGDLQHGLSAGVEYMAFFALPFRLGFKYRPAQAKTLLSLGIGINMGGFGLDAFYQQHLTVGKIRTFGLALRVNI